MSEPDNEPHEQTMHRLTISIRPDTHDSVVRMAQKNRVSAAWIIREAIEDYLNKDVPLFATTRRQTGL